MVLQSWNLPVSWKTATSLFHICRSFLNLKFGSLYILIGKRDSFCFVLFCFVFNELWTSLYFTDESLGGYSTS